MMSFRCDDVRRGDVEADDKIIDNERMEHPFSQRELHMSGLACSLACVAFAEPTTYLPTVTLNTIRKIDRRLICI